MTPPWLESSAREITLHPEEADSNITQKAFEIALRRLYGYYEPDEEAANPFSMLATACWLEMQDLIDDSVNAILRTLNSANLTQTIKQVTTNCYGKAGAKILASTQCILIREGIDLPVAFFDDLPAEVVQDVMSSDGFYVRNEFDRWSFAKHVLDRRLRSLSSSFQLLGKAGRLKKAPRRLRKFQDRLRSYNEVSSESGSEEDLPDEYKVWIELYSHPEVEPLLKLLDHGIYYMHLTFEQLQIIKAAKDTFGFPVVPERQISTALWESLELRQKVVNARSKELSLGLTHSSDEHLPTSFLNFNNSPRISVADIGPSSSSATETNTPTSRSSTDNTTIKHWIPVNDCSVPLGRYPFDLATRRSRSSPRPDDRPNRPTTYPPTSDEDSQRFPYSFLPPFRFAVQFDKPQHLPERKRIYSQTFFYAGSYWNIYIQKLQPSTRSKRLPRLGFYLHRTKGPDGEDGPLNFVDEQIRTLERGFVRPSGPNYGGTTSDFGRPYIESTSTEDATDHLRAAMHSAMSRPFSASRCMDNNTHENTNTSSLLDDEHSFFDSHQDSPPANHSNHLNTSSHTNHRRTPQDPNRPNHPHPTLPPYIDTRPTVRAYFKIHTITPNGRHLNVHQSVPDKFNFSQSWGWKSSTMMGEEEWWADGEEGEGEGMSVKLGKLEVDFEGVGEDKERDLEGGGGGVGGSEGKLRFMVAVGLV